MYLKDVALEGKCFQGCADLLRSRCGVHVRQEVVFSHVVVVPGSHDDRRVEVDEIYYEEGGSVCFGFQGVACGERGEWG